MLCNVGALGYDTTELKDKIQEMVAAGSRYMNLEKELGWGTAFVLGTEVADSTL